MFPKPFRFVDRPLLNSIKNDRCVACNKRDADPAHIRSRGAGGEDVWYNVMPLCRVHHSFQHAKGWKTFSDKFEAVALDLKAKGWTFDEFNKLIFNGQK